MHAVSFLANASVAIIGGADGPTVIFVAGSVWPLALIAVAVAAAVVAAVILLRRRKNKNK